jgi:hypothetical protein
MSSATTVPTLGDDDKSLGDAKEQIGWLQKKVDQVRLLAVIARRGALLLKPTVKRHTHAHSDSRSQHNCTHAVTTNVLHSLNTRHTHTTRRNNTHQGIDPALVPVFLTEALALTRQYYKSGGAHDDTPSESTLAAASSRQKQLGVEARHHSNGDVLNRMLVARGPPSGRSAAAAFSVGASPSRMSSTPTYRHTVAQSRVSVQHEHGSGGHMSGRKLNWSDDVLDLQPHILPVDVRVRLSSARPHLPPPTDDDADDGADVLSTNSDADGDGVGDGGGGGDGAGSSSVGGNDAAVDEVVAAAIRQRFQTMSTVILSIEDDDDGQLLAAADGDDATVVNTFYRDTKRRRRKLMSDLGFQGQLLLSRVHYNHQVGSIQSHMPVFFSVYHFFLFFPLFSLVFAFFSVYHFFPSLCYQTLTLFPRALQPPGGFNHALSLFASSFLFLFCLSFLPFSSLPNTYSLTHYLSVCTSTHYLSVCTSTTG